jgi:hypothetical protein
MRVVGLVQLKVEMLGLAMATVKHCFDKISFEVKQTYLLQNLERSKLSEANTIINILCWIKEKTNIISKAL